MPACGVPRTCTSLPRTASPTTWARETPRRRWLVALPQPILIAITRSSACPRLDCASSLCRGEQGARRHRHFLDHPPSSSSRSHHSSCSRSTTRACRSDQSRRRCQDKQIASTKCSDHAIPGGQSYLGQCIRSAAFEDLARQAVTAFSRLDVCSFRQRQVGRRRERRCLVFSSKEAQGSSERLEDRPRQSRNPRQRQ